MKFKDLPMNSHFTVWRPKEQDPDGHDKDNHEGKMYKKITCEHGERVFPLDDEFIGRAFPFEEDLVICPKL